MFTGNGGLFLTLGACGCVDGGLDSLLLPAVFSCVDRRERGSKRNS